MAINVDEASIPVAGRSSAQLVTKSQSKRYAAYVLFVLLMMNTFAFLDRAIFNTLSQAIKKDLHLSDTELGFLGGFGFVLVYTFCALPIARLSERVRRIDLIGICVVFWSLATAASGLAANYIQMLLARVAVGAGESGATPTAHSVIGDYFPADRRASAIAVFVLGLPLGVMLGSFVGGQIAQHFGWRVAFFAVGLPGILIALLMKLTIKEPERGAADGKQKLCQETPSLLAVLKHLLSRRSARHITAAFTISSFSTGGIYVFLPAILIRQYGFSIGEAGLIYGSLAGIATALGMMFGGFVNDKMGKRDRRWFAWFPRHHARADSPAHHPRADAGPSASDDRDPDHPVLPEDSVSALSARVLSQSHRTADARDDDHDRVHVLEHRRQRRRAAVRWRAQRYVREGPLPRLLQRCVPTGDERHGDVRDARSLRHHDRRHRLFGDGLLGGIPFLYGQQNHPR